MPRRKDGPAGLELPKSEEMERAVLGGIFMQPQLLPTIEDIVDVPDLYMRRHQLIYRAIKRVREDQLDVDTLTVQAELERTNEFEEAGGLAYLIGLDLGLPDLSRVPMYAEQVARLAANRRAIQAADRIRLDLANGASADEAVAALVSAAHDLEASHSRDDENWSLGDCLSLAEPPESYVEVVGLRTGLGKVDRHTRGLVGGRLYVGAGRPGAGKTSFATGIALHCAASGSPAMIVSLEMPRDEVARRAASVVSGIPYEQLETGRLSAHQRQVYSETRAQMDTWPLAINTEARTLPAICGASRKLQRSMGLSLLVIDYLSLIDIPVGAYSNREQGVAEASRRIKTLAMELDIPVILLAQMNREVTKRGSWVPILSDLRESGAIEQDADVVLFVCDPAEGKGKSDPEALKWANKRAVVLAKVRQGKKGILKVGWDGPTMRMFDLETGS